MPVISIMGISRVRSSSGSLSDLLKKAVSDIPELDLQANQVSVFYPVIHWSPEEAKDIVAFVDIFDKPKRTDEVRQCLAEAIRETLISFADENRVSWDLVEVFIRPLQEEDGFASAIRKDDSVILDP